MPDELIDIVMEIDDFYMENNPILDSEYVEKRDKINEYAETYKSHMVGVSHSTAKIYSEKRFELKRQYQRKLELGYEI